MMRHKGKPQVVALFGQNFSFRAVVFLSILLIFWKTRFPFVFNKIYGEDGALFLVDALKFRFPLDLFEPAAGYSTLIMRIGGRIASVFPIENAALVSGVFTAFCLSFLAAGLFQYNNFRSQNFWIRLTLSMSFIFLPLASFSAVGNIANLYVYFMSASAVFLYYHEKTKWEAFFKSLVLFIAALSLPLTIFLVPILLHRIYLENKEHGYWGILKSDCVFLGGLIFQFVFIILTSLGDRVPNPPQSLFKVVYLYLERGIGISLIPRWGFVSETAGKIGYENSAPWLHSTNTRLVIVLSVIALFAVAFYRNRFKISRASLEQIFFLVFLGLSYSLLIGLFFNPEPRYMIFASFLTFWATLLLLESQENSKLRLFACLYILLVIFVGLTASNHRSQGPDWRTSIEEARQFCLNSSEVQDVQIRTLPVDSIWEMVIPCEKLR